MIYDILILIIFKLILIIGFTYLLTKWKAKSGKKLPSIIYWILGLFFVFVMSFNIIEWLLNFFFYKEGSLLADKSSLNSLSALIGLVVYFIIGIKYFSKRKNIKN